MSPDHLEIERKFLVCQDHWRYQVESSVLIKQAYLANDGAVTVRVRVMGEKAFITIKGPTRQISRSEFEYEIPLTDAEVIFTELCPGGKIEKKRHRLRHAGRLWEVDEFTGRNAPLILAEVELESEDAVLITPDWIGAEVSSDPRYYNVNLMVAPYRDWGS